MHQRPYTRLKDFERESISKGISSGKTAAHIARSLDRPISAVTREIARNGGRDSYRAFRAEKKSWRRSSSRKKGKSLISKHEALRKYVIVGLIKKWSPVEIVSRMKAEYPSDMTMRISHEAIYQYIYVLPRGYLKETLIKSLRQERVYRRKQKKDSKDIETRGKIANMLSIEERPAEVADRSVPGHWEGDLILGKNKRSALGTLVERTTRYTILVPLKAKDATSVRKAFAQEFKKIPSELKRSLTYDQGKEMSEHKRFTIDTGITVFFAHPSSPWERGTNENTNGLIRQYFPKGTDFTLVPTREVKRVQRSLNDRPRAVLDYLKPDEVINNVVALDA